MKLAVASGKGGTGKTTVAVALALAAKGEVQYLDCDVEEPNGQIFLHPKRVCREGVTVPIPALNSDLCNGCGECGSICQFNAIVALQTKPLVFAELCHGCGGCVKVCPQQALVEKHKTIGQLTMGGCGHISYIQGRLAVGEAMSPPLIRAVKKYLRPDVLNIIDCPPGTSCPMISAVRDSDFTLLVTEPTPFGLHDLELAVAAMRELQMPCGVVINRCDSGDRRVEEYCHAQQVPIMASIPEHRCIAEAYSRGETVLDAVPAMRPLFARLLDAVRLSVAGRAA